jgi:hypothetical protein
MEIGQRVNWIIGHFCAGNKTEFARRMGDPSGRSSKFDLVIKGKTQPSYETLTTILAQFPQVSGDWLLAGEGAPLKNETGKNPGTSKPVIANTDDVRELRRIIEEQHEEIKSLTAEKDKLSRALATAVLGKRMGSNGASGIAIDATDKTLKRRLANSMPQQQGCDD